MKEVYGWYLPDDDVHFTQYLESLKKAGEPIEYQRAQRETALKHCDQFRNVLLRLNRMLRLSRFFISNPLAQRYIKLHSARTIPRNL